MAISSHLKVKKNQLFSLCYNPTIFTVPPTHQNFTTTRQSTNYLIGQTRPGSGLRSSTSITSRTMDPSLPMKQRYTSCGRTRPSTVSNIWTNSFRVVGSYKQRLFSSSVGVLHVSLNLSMKMYYNTIFLLNVFLNINNCLKSLKTHSFLNFLTSITTD